MSAAVTWTRSGSFGVTPGGWMIVAGLWSGGERFPFMVFDGDNNLVGKFNTREEAEAAAVA